MYRRSASNDLCDRIQKSEDKAIFFHIRLIFYNLSCANNTKYIGNLDTMTIELTLSPKHEIYEYVNLIF